MNNYLMFGHILKCRVVPKEQVHEKLWKGADKRFKKVPWSKLEGRKLAMGMGEAGWEKRIEGEKQRRKAKEEKLKAIGYEFEAPVLKGVADIKNRTDEKTIEGPERQFEAGEVATIDQEPSTTIVVREEVTTRTAKKHKKRKAEKIEIEEKVEVKVKKAKKPEKSTMPGGEEKVERSHERGMMPVGDDEAPGTETRREKPRKTKRSAEGVEADTTKAEKTKKAKKASM